MASSELTDLVPSTPYALAYTLPLLLFSLVLLFAGSFLTVDRTRSFAPSKDAPNYSTLPGFNSKSRKRRVSWFFEGGVGGLAMGYAFGVHISTLLALLIPSTTSSATLSPKSFLAVWILCSIPTIVLGSRFRIVALLLAGIIGGFTLALALTVILHPSLLPRQILLGVFSFILVTLLLTSHFIPRLTSLLRPALRIACASTGSFGLILSISLLTSPRILGWANVWERLWIANGDPASWGTNKEKALSAAYALFAAFGLATDWALHRWVGECPDEKWDKYLSKYVSDPPNFPNRAGTFRPVVSFWDRVFGGKGSGEDAARFLGLPGHGQGHAKEDSLVFPEDTKDLKHPVDAYYALPPPKPTSPAFKLRSAKTGEHIPSGAGFLKKKKTRTRKTKKPLKFGSIDELSSSDDSSGDEKENLKDKSPKRPWVVTNQHPSYSSEDSSAPTLVDGAKRSEPPTPVVPAPAFPVPSIPQTTRSKERHPVEADVVDIDYDKELERLRSQPSRPLSKTSSRKSVPPATAPAPMGLERHAEHPSDDVDDLEANPKGVKGGRSPPPRWDDFWKEVRVKASGAQ